jgi:integral membrane protein (TIGR01906 family)
LRLPTILKGVAAGLFILSLPVLFGTTSLRWLVADAGWYRAGFEKYGVSQTTGMSSIELAKAAEQISRYLLFQRERADDIMVQVRGQTVPLFNEREDRHMSDVRELMGRFYTLQVASGAYALLYLVGSRFWLRGGYRRAIGSQLQGGGGLTLGLFAVLGAGSLMDFDQLFLQFHLISFSNSDWILDPTKDRLIMMFPEGFWYDSAIRLALATGGQALASIIVGGLLKRSASGRKPLASS